MASGKKNYFRHSFFARNDIKLRRLRDEVGVGFYFYFFTLLEQCGEASSEELKENYEFHDSIIRSLWCINLKKSERVASVMHSVGLLFFEKRENTFYFEIPNLSKYLGKYESKSISNTPNKRKENKIKVNEIKEKEQHENFSLDACGDIWNEVMPENVFGRSTWLSGNQLRIAGEMMNIFKTKKDFEEYFIKIKNNPKFNGSGKIQAMTYVWAMNPDNIAKVLGSKEKDQTPEEINAELDKLLSGGF